MHRKPASHDCSIQRAMKGLTVYTMMNKAWFQSKIGKPILKFLGQGISPEKLSLSIAIGAAIGILPIVGVTTLIGFAIAIIFRLNVPVVQLLNYMVYPLQFVLIIPFISLGAFIFQSDLSLSSINHLDVLADNSFWVTIASFSEMIFYAIIAWLLTCIPLSALVYFAAVGVLRRVDRNREGNPVGKCDLQPCSTGDNGFTRNINRKSECCRI